MIGPRFETADPFTQTRFPAMPVALPVGLSATLGRLAEALGHRALYERYS